MIFTHQVGREGPLDLVVGDSLPWSIFELVDNEIRFVMRLYALDKLYQLYPGIIGDVLVSIAREATFVQNAIDVICYLLKKGIAAGQRSHAQINNQR